MKLGYNTNGLAFHRWTEALELLADIGYESVAITLDHSCLDPYAAGLAHEVARMADYLGRLRFSCVVETGARYLLNPGSVGQPRDKDWRAAFALYESDSRLLTFYRVPYEVGSTQERIMRAGLPDVLALRLRQGR